MQDSIACEIYTQLLWHWDILNMKRCLFQVFKAASQPGVECFEMSSVKWTQNHSTCLIIMLTIPFSCCLTELQHDQLLILDCKVILGQFIMSIIWSVYCLALTTPFWPAFHRCVTSNGSNGTRKWPENLKAISHILYNGNKPWYADNIWKLNGWVIIFFKRQTIQNANQLHSREIPYLILSMTKKGSGPSCQTH